MATALDIRSEIQRLDDDDLIWSAIVRHADGTIETHGFDGNARTLLAHGEAAELAEMREISFVVSDAPIPCAVARLEPRLELLGDCPACS